jgi:hypothetical protein
MGLTKKNCTIGDWLIMDGKQKNNMWICGMFGWLAVTIGLRLSTRSNLIVVGIAMLIFLIVMIKDRKRLAGFDIIGRLCLLGGGLFVLSVMTGILQGMPLFWGLSMLALFGIGVCFFKWGQGITEIYRGNQLIIMFFSCKYYMCL